MIARQARLCALCVAMFVVWAVGDSRVIQVTTLNDVIDAGACGTIVYADLPGADGEISLREAICVAENEPGHDTITFQPAMSGTINVFTPFETIDDGDLDIINAAGGEIVIGGGLAVRLFRVENGVTLNITNLTLSGGAGDINGGGAILNLSSTVTLERCRIVDSKSIANGGGILTLGGTMNVVDSVVDNCFTDGAGLKGGGIAVADMGALNIIRSRITNNRAIFPNNDGGGIFSGTGIVTIIDSEISGNETTNSGGGIYSNSGLTIRRSTIWGNSVSNDSGGGGGMWIADGTVLGVNSTFSGNSTNGFGGGVFIGNGTADFVNCTFAYNVGDANSAGLGGGGALGQLGGTLRIGNCFFAENEDDVTQNFNVPGSVVSLGHNFIQNVGTANFANNTTGDIYGDPLNTTTPDAGAFESPSHITSFLLPLQHNGGPTPTHALGITSDAVDAGDNSLVTSPEFDGPPFTDQRGTGFDRIVDGDDANGATVDIGAYEKAVQFPQIVVTTADDNDDGLVGPGELSLREAVKLAPTNGSRITFDESLFTNNSVLILLGPSGESQAITIEKPVQIEAPEGRRVRLSGENTNQIFRITPMGAMILYDCDLINGFAAFGMGGGGAVLANENLVALNCRFFNNTSEENGGAVRMSGISTGTFAQCLFEGNDTTSVGAHGGAIAIDAGADGRFTECDFLRNTTVLASPAHGGAIYVNGINSSVRLMRCNVAHNEASGDGGGVFAESDASLEIDQSAIFGNTAESNSNAAGGVEFTGGAHGHIRNSTVSGNITNGHGGGVVVFGSVEGVLLEFVTIADNVCDFNDDSSGDGGGLYQVGGLLEINHCLIADNEDVGGEFPDVQGSNITSLGYNLIGDVGGMNFSSNTMGDQYGDPAGTTTVNAGAVESDVAIDPMIGNLQVNGGLTATHALLQGSPAIDAGADVSLNDVDQRGTPRPLDGDGDATMVVDIGAFEANNEPNPAIIVSTLDDNNDGKLGWWELSLREAVMIAPPDSTITFADHLIGAILIGASGENSHIHINKSLRIVGPETVSIAVHGQSDVSAFTISTTPEVEIENLAIINGRESNAGGILNGGNLTLRNCLLLGNSTTGSGAAIYNFGHLWAFDTTFVGNENDTVIFSNGGGAVLNADDTGDGASAWIERCLAVSNGADTITGGAFKNQGNGNDAGDTILTLVNTTIVDNKSRFGGAVYTTGTDTTTHIRHCTIIDNTATEGTGGVQLVSGTVNIANSILFNNTGAANGDLNGSFTVNYSLIGNATFGNITGANNIIGEDPMLAELEYLTNDWALYSPQPGSPAIDAAHPINFENLDARRVPRATDGDGNGAIVADMGAIEFVPFVHVDQINGDDTFNGAQWNVDGMAGPVRTIRRGMEIATAGGEVWVRQGVHQPIAPPPGIGLGGPANIAVQLKSNVGVYGGFAGTELVRGQRSQDPNLTIIDASAATDGGPAFHAVGMSQVDNALLDGFTITGGAALGSGVNSAGGGILVSANMEQCAISNCVIRDNSARSAGGGVFSSPNSNLHIVNTAIRDNDVLETGLGGGGIHIQEANVVIENSTISANHSNAIAGGVHIRTSDVQILNSTISGNTANEYAGGLFVNESPLNNIQMDSVTIANNTSGLDGSYVAGGTFINPGGVINVANTLIAGNSDSGAGSPDFVGLFDNGGYNLIGDLGLTHFGNNTDGDQYGDPLGSTSPNAGAMESATAIDPMIGPLADNGGFTLTHELLTGSPAIDAANPTAGLTADQRGAFRPSDGDNDNTAVSDIGAFEVEDQTPDFGYILVY